MLLSRSAPVALADEVPSFRSVPRRRAAPSRAAAAETIRSSAGDRSPEVVSTNGALPFRSHLPAVGQAMPPAGAFTRNVFAGGLPRRSVCG